VTNLQCNSIGSPVHIGGSEAKQAKAGTDEAVLAAIYPAARNARTAADRIPGGRAEVLPGLGHCVAFERSDLVLAHVRPFLASVDLG